MTNIKNSQMYFALGFLALLTTLITLISIYTTSGEYITSNNSTLCTNKIGSNYTEETQNDAPTAVYPIQTTTNEGVVLSNLKEYIFETTTNMIEKFTGTTNTDQTTGNSFSHIATTRPNSGTNALDSIKNSYDHEYQSGLEHGDKALTNKNFYSNPTQRGDIGILDIDLSAEARQKMDKDLSELFQTINAASYTNNYQLRYGHNQQFSNEKK